jgi:hypothetical protein
MTQDVLDLLEPRPAAPAPSEKKLQWLATEVSLIGQLFNRACSELNEAAEQLGGSTSRFEEAWRRVVREVAEGKTAEMHALRPKFEGGLASRLNMLRQAVALAAVLRRMSGEGPAPDPAPLEAEAQRLEHLKARILYAWQTAEDLEDLAARDYPLTTAHLDQAGPQRRPDASWYAETGKPF